MIKTEKRKRHWVVGSNSVDTGRILRKFILSSYLSMRKAGGKVGKDKYDEIMK